MSYFVFDLALRYHTRLFDRWHLNAMLVIVVEQVSGTSILRALMGVIL